MLQWLQPDSIYLLQDGNTLTHTFYKEILRGQCIIFNSLKTSKMGSDSSFYAHCQ